MIQQSITFPGEPVQLELPFPSVLGRFITGGDVYIDTEIIRSRRAYWYLPSVPLRLVVVGGDED